MVIKIVEVLPAGFDMVHVDFYEWSDKVYFNELTFTPWEGFVYSFTNDEIKIFGDKVKNKN